MSEARDIKDAYRQALTEEYEAYKRSGRDADAKYVAGVLSKHYGVQVTPEETKQTKDAETEDGEQERAEQERPPEDTAKPPAKRSPGRPRKPSQAEKD